MNREHLPWRIRTTIIIFNDSGKILTTVVPTELGTIYAFPGGGIEDNENLVSSVKREALEEVGVDITDVQEIDYPRSEVIYTKKFFPDLHLPKFRKRYDSYKGEQTIYVSAKFIKKNKKLLGLDNDSRNYVWMSPKELYNQMSNHYKKYRSKYYDPEMVEHRINLVKKYI